MADRSRDSHRDSAPAARQRGRAGSKSHSPPPRTPPPGGWDHVAAWYDQLVGETGSDYHQHVILPNALELLNLQPGEYRRYNKATEIFFIEQEDYSA